MRPKLIYLARRNPALTPEGFVPRWRQHGALGMSLPRWKNVWRYAHNDVLPGQAYDGVGIVWHRSPEARRAHREDRSSQGVMERDELETFDDLILRSCALYEEEIVMPPATGARIKLIRFDDETAPLPADARGHIRNRRLPPEAGEWGLRHTLIEEVWFDDLEAAQIAASETPGLIARETILYRLGE